MSSGKISLKFLEIFILCVLLIRCKDLCTLIKSIKRERNGINISKTWRS